MKLIDELKRRNVFRVGATYVLLGWLVVQVTETVAPALGLPDWTLRFVIWIGVVGLPFALFFAWAYELTPEGLKREDEVRPVESITSVTGRKLDVLLVSLLLIASLFIAWDFLDSGSHPTTPSVPANEHVAADTTESPAQNAIVVLPLVNMSALADNAFFAAGVHEEILTNLSRIEGLRVVSRTTALRYVDSGMGMQDIGRELDVRYIVEGSVRRINDHVRITVQLIDALKDAHLWASNYDRELIDVFATQSEVAKEISNSLHLEIQPDTVGTLSGMPTESVRAYDLYIKAESINRSELETESSLRRQRELLEAALEEDPEFVEAWGFLNEILDHSARLIIQEQLFGDTAEQRQQNFIEIRDAAERALQKAVALDPDNFTTLMALASDFVAEQEQPGFNERRKQYIDQALEIEPDNALAWLVLGWWYRIQGDQQAATPAFRKALELDPLHARIVYSSLIHFRLVGDQEMTTMLFDRLAQIAPEKKDETSLAQIPFTPRFFNRIELFAETADETIVDSLAVELQAYLAEQKDVKDSDNAYFNQAISWMMQAQILGIQNRLEELADLEPPAAPENLVSNLRFFQLRIATLLLSVNQALGNEEQVRDIANQMAGIAVSELDPPVFDFMRFTAYQALGDDEKVGQIRNKYAGKLEGYPMWPTIMAMHIDTDGVVDWLLQQKRDNRHWFGTDLVAVNFFVTGPLVTHPKMQAFYKDEGKWTNFLAERLPEYR